MDFTTEHIRHCMLFQFKSGVNATVATKNICAVYPEAISVRQCQNWFQRFREGDFDLKDKPRPGAVPVVNDDVLRADIESNPRQTTYDLAERYGCCQKTIWNHLHAIGKVCKLSVWVPHKLTDENRTQRTTICSGLLSRQETDPFLERIITGDEKWVLYVNVQRDKQWLDPNQKPLPTAKAGLHPKKVLLSVWWDISGIVYWELLEKNRTIDAELYCQQLDRLSQKIRPILLNRKGVVLQHDNARPHTARLTREKIQRLGWEVLPHPPYSPDIAPSDYHLFRSLQNHLNGQEFPNREAVESEISKFFASKTTDFYRKGIEDLPKRWAQVVESDGEYIDS
jgi:histone-lysine N-methyltransferase SETMAR